MRALACTVALTLGTASAQDFATSRARVAEFLDRQCAHCHDADAKKGGLDFDSLLEAETPTEWLTIAPTLRRATWRAIDGVMPPLDEDERPMLAERRAFAAWFEASVRAAARAMPVDPGTPTLRRLNRVQYRNTVRAVFGVDVDVARFLPEDPVGSGFDVVGDAQIVGPLIVEAYLEATDAILDAIFSEPAREQDLFGGTGDPAHAVDAALGALLRRAFRRPPTTAQLGARAELYRSLAADTGSIAIARRRVLQSILLSPHFLYRLEDDGEDVQIGQVRALDDHELATRLAYFLWSGPGDQTLDGRADRGELRGNLSSELRRMLRDPRARTLADEFAGQWLGFRAIRTIARDVRRFRFGGELRAAMYEEAAATFERIVREDRSILELLDADWTIANETLAKHYEIDIGPGTGMRVVPLADRRRGGVLGWAATLTATSNGIRTNPVLRGRFVLEELCGDPPPPPPPNVGSLPEDDRQKDGLSLRARLERHRGDPRCASCHARMDPFGLALESFDAIGKFRDSDEDRPLDPCVDWAGVATFDGIVDVKDWLVARKDRFLRVFAARLFVFAIGREPGPTDEPTLLAMIDAAEREGYRFGAVVEALCTSDPFLLRRTK